MAHSIWWIQCLALAFPPPLLSALRSTVFNLASDAAPYLIFLEQLILHTLANICYTGLSEVVKFDPNLNHLAWLYICLYSKIGKCTTICRQLEIIVFSQFVIH